MSILLVICLIVLGALAGALTISIWWAWTMRKPGAIIGFAQGLAATGGDRLLAEMCHCPFCKTPLTSEPRAAKSEAEVSDGNA